MKFNIPSYSKMVGTFILIGPLIWLMPLLLVGRLSYLSNSSKILNLNFPEFNMDLLNLIASPFTTMPASGLFWWSSVFQPVFWLVTWMPTVLAALIFKYFLNLSTLNFFIFISRKTFAGYCALLSAVVSAITYTFTAFISTQLTQPNLHPREHNFLNYEDIITVFIVGFVLGLIVGFSPKHTPENITSKI